MKRSSSRRTVAPAGSHNGNPGPTRSSTVKSLSSLPSFLWSRLSQELQVLFELALRGPGGAVDPRQLRLLLVTPPVSAGDAQQLECLQVPGGLDVRPTTEVEEIAGAVNAHLVPLDLVFDQLDLVVLSAPPELCQCLLARHGLLREGSVLLREAAHARLDCRQIRLRHRLAEGEVVVKAVLHWRPDAVPGVRVQLGDGRGEEVGRRMPQDMQRVLA